MDKKNILQETENLLKDAHSKTISLAVDAKKSGAKFEKIKWQLRRKYIEKELQFYERINEQNFFPKTVFISYGRSGESLFEYLKGKLESDGYEVITGFIRRENTEGNVLKKVLKNLSLSTLYLGILTKDLEIKHEGEIKWAPSVWTIEEKGMALAQEKPFVLIVDSEIHSHYWKKTTPDKDHIIFNGKDEFYQSKADDAVSELNMRYNEIALSYLNESSDKDYF